MAAIGETGHEHLRLQGARELGAQHHGTERQMCTGEALGERHQVGARIGSVALPGEPLAAAAESTHHFIGDQPYFRGTGGSAQRRPELIGRDDAVRTRARLHHHRCDIAGTELSDHVLDVAHRGDRALRCVRRAEGTAVGVGRRHAPDAKRSGVDLRCGAGVSRQRHRGELAPW